MFSIPEQEKCAFKMTGYNLNAYCNYGVRGPYISRKLGNKNNDTKICLIVETFGYI